MGNDGARYDVELGRLSQQPSASAGLESLDHSRRNHRTDPTLEKWQRLGHDGLRHEGPLGNSGQADEYPGDEVAFSSPVLFCTKCLVTIS